MKRQIALVLSYWCLFLLLVPATTSAAQDRFVPLVEVMDKMAAQLERGVATEKLAHKFHPFIVAQAAAEALLNGLQYSQKIALMNPAAGKIERFKPVTKPMSLANAYMALSLAQLQLQQYGISQPTPAQIKLVLNGGQFAVGYAAGKHAIRLEGILKQRAKGQHWEHIAQALRVDPVVLRYDLQAASYALTSHTVIPSYAAIKAFPESPDEPVDDQDLNAPVPQAATPETKSARTSALNIR